LQQFSSYANYLADYGDKVWGGEKTTLTSKKRLLDFAILSIQHESTLLTTRFHSFTKYDSKILQLNQK